MKVGLVRALGVPVWFEGTEENSSVSTGSVSSAAAEGTGAEHLSHQYPRAQRKSRAGCGTQLKEDITQTSTCVWTVHDGCARM